MDAFENLCNLLDEFVAGGVGLEGRAAQRIHVQIPRAQAFKAHFLGAALVHFALQGEDELLDALVEGLAVVRSVVETALGEEDIVDVVLAAGVLGNLVANLEQPIEGVVERLFVLEAAFPDGAPGFLAQVAVCPFEVSADLLQRLDASVELNAHAAGNLLVVLDGLGFFGREGDVSRVEQVERNLHALEPDAKFSLQVVETGVGDELLVQLVVVFVRDGFDIFYKISVGLGGGLVLGVQRHRYVAAAGNFGQHRFQFAPLENPAAERGGRGLNLGGEERLE